jgi:hypothetical protein
MSYLIIGDPSGLHCLRLIEKGVSQDNITVWEDSNKGKYIVSRLRGCRVVSELEELNGMKFDVVVGNPPYGSGGNLAIRFLNKCGDLSDDIRLVLPVSIRKPSSQNKVRLDLVCVEDEDLSDETFGKNITAVRQRWIKTDSLRNKIQTFTTHPDFEFVKKVNNPDIMIFRCGASTGKVTDDFVENKPDHYYIKADNDTIDRLKSITPELIDISKNVNGMPGISKHELITTYISHYG